MPRRASKTHRREVQPDAVYNNRLVTQLINKVLLDGKKSTAERVVYGAFDIVAKKSEQDALAVFKKAMDNVRPTLEGKPKRVGGATYQVPMEVNSRRATHPRHPLDRELLPRPQGEDHGRASCQRDPRRLQRRRRFHQEVARISSRWPRPTAPSLTTASSPRDRGKPYGKA